MIIRRKQFDDFLQHDEPKFIDMFIEHLQEQSPELVEDIPLDDLHAMVANGIARARSHGLYTDEDLMAFVAVMFEIAPNFDEHPAIRRVLADNSIPLEKRFDALFEKVPDEAWEEAEENYDAGAWFPELLDEED